MPKTMNAALFIEPGCILLDKKPVSDMGPLDVLVRIMTTICGTDVHILKGKYVGAKGLTFGDKAVGAVEKLGSAVRGYTGDQRAIAGAICTSATAAALCGCHV